MSTHHDFNMACIEHLPSTFGSWAWRLQWRSKSMRTSLQEERTSASLRSKLSAWVSCHSFGRRQERWLNPNNRTAVTWLNKIFLIEENLWLSWFLDTFLLDTLFFWKEQKWNQNQKHSKMIENWLIQIQLRLCTFGAKLHYTALIQEVHDTWTSTNIDS